jgi:PTH1 family peptidyl-tRNA hydrolase
MAALRLIVGLGNPGADHSRTRHNAGFWFLDALAERWGARLSRDAKLHAETGKVNVDGAAVWLLKPTTYMNRSGQSVSAALRYYKIEPDECLDAHDELDLPPGAARLKFDGGHGGQNGLRDIIAALGHGKFHRLRLGIGHPGDKHQVTNWVLGRPGRDDEAAIRDAVARSLQVLPQAAAGDLNAAMKLLHTPAGAARPSTGVRPPQ